MRRTLSVSQHLLLLLTAFAVAPTHSYAVIGDAQLCPGTGLECVVSSKIQIADPQGVDVRPLTLRIKALGSLLADDNPIRPLTIKAGQIIIEAGGSVLGKVSGGQGNTLHLVADSITIAGIVDASSARVNSTGGDGGSITLTAPGSCTVSGKVLANGTRSTSIGGSGGDILFDCGGIAIERGALIDASASGPGGAGGNISVGANGDVVNIDKGATLRVLGAALDGGAVSISTNANDPNDSCTIAGKILGDAKVVGHVGGAGGAVDISCGGNVTLGDGAVLHLTGTDGGGSLDVFSGANFVLSKQAAVRANSSAGEGGDTDIVAANNVTVSGKIDIRSGGESDNDGTISITNDGDLVIATGASLNASAGRKDLQAGQIVMAGGVGTPTTPHLTVEQGALLKANGHGSGFGSLDVDLSGGDCTVAGSILGDGQTDNSIAVGFECDSFTLASTGVIQANSKAGSPTGTVAGSLTIDTTGEETGDAPGACALDGKVLLKGASATGTDPVTLVKFPSAGQGGSLDVNCGLGLSVGDRAVIDVSASGQQSVGGHVALSANLASHVSGTIKAKAGGAFSAGGRIAVAAPDLYLDPVPGALDTGAESGGSVELLATDGAGATGTLSIGKPLNASGSHFGGSVVARGCMVSVGPLGWLRADGPPTAGGVNQLSGRNSLSVSGKMTALNGQNVLLFSNTLNPSLAGTIKPTALRDPSLSPCS